MNILRNPTGKKGRFRGVDWIVEHNNLYTKVSTNDLSVSSCNNSSAFKRIYAGKFSNRTKKRLIAESSLIEVYKNVRIQFERMFCLNRKTTQHSPPKMRKTFAKLGEYIRRERTNEYIKGRKSAYEVPDVMKKGAHISMTMNEPDAMEVDGDGEWMDVGDEMEEVEDDGGLDMD